MILYKAKVHFIILEGLPCGVQSIDVVNIPQDGSFSAPLYDSLCCGIKI